MAGPVRVFVFLEGVVDIGGEKARLEKEIARITKDLSTISKKLANSDFREKAAEAVIRKEENKYQEFQGKLEILEGALARLKKIAV